MLLWFGVIRPIQADLACWRGMELMAEKPRAALAALESAVRRQPWKPFYWLQLGGAAQAAARQAGDTNERIERLLQARRACEQAIELTPVDAFGHANLGRVLTELTVVDQATPSEALAAFDRALALDRRNAELYFHAANAALQLGEIGKTKEYASSATNLYPRFAPAWAQLGYAALAESRCQDADAMLDRALRLDWFGHGADYTMALANRATALLQLRGFEPAAVFAGTALERDPEYLLPRCNLALALESLGRREEAKAEWSRVLARQPDHPLAKSALGRLGGAGAKPQAASASSFSRRIGPECRK